MDATAEHVPYKVQITPDVVYGRKFGLAQTLDLYQPPEATGALVLLMNSGGFVSGKIRQYEPVPAGMPRFVPAAELLLVPEGFHYPPLEQFSIQELLAAGITVGDVRHGCSPRFKLEEIVADVRLALGFMRENAVRYGIDPTRIGLFGGSAGGYLASYLALTPAKDEPPIAAVAVYYPAGWDWVSVSTEYPEVYENLPALHINEELLDDLSLRGHVNAGSPPHLIIAGDQDYPFILSTCRKLHEVLSGRGVESELLLIEGTGHEFTGEDGYHTLHGERARSRMVAWFVKHLR